MQRRAAALDDEAVLRRWTQLFDGPLLVQKSPSWLPPMTVQTSTM